MITKDSKVIMNGKYKVSKAEEGKVFEVRSEPYNICGTKCVLLEGKTGGYAVDGLTEIKEAAEE